MKDSETMPHFRDFPLSSRVTDVPVARRISDVSVVEP
jgi:hypothetical protein